MKNFWRTTATNEVNYPANKNLFTASNTKISTYSLEWKFCVNGRFAQNSVETMQLYKILPQDIR